MRYTFADLIKAVEAEEAVERMKADLAEFAEQYLPEATEARDGLIDFLDIATGDAFEVTPIEALNYFRSKGLQTSFSYADLYGRAHDQAFTVAKMMDVDLLAQVRQSLDDTLATGTTFRDWQADLEPMLRKAGWWGESVMPDPLTGKMVNAQLGSARRLQTIFRTNLQTAYAAGQWRQIVEQSQIAPYLMYDAVDDLRTRPAHREWDGKILPVDSPWWKSHMPPNGWNCRCGVIQLDAEQVESMGLSPSTEPADETFQWTNPRTGESVAVPKGLDPGFDRNPGDILNGDLREILREKVSSLPESMRSAIAPVLRRRFDASTASGTWHATSFDASPEWVREKVLDLPDVQVITSPNKSAHAIYGRLVDMDSHRNSTPKGQETWRHEFGHILDARLAVTALYRSAQDDFVAAQKADADALVVTAGRGRKSRSNDARRALVVEAYQSAHDEIMGALPPARTDILRNMAADAGLNLGSFLSVLRDISFVIDSPDDLADAAKAVRVARLIQAVRLRDGEGFIRLALHKDLLEDLQARRVYDKGVLTLVEEGWRKGALASISDLIGSATRNRVASYNAGFAGHRDSYYRQAPFMSMTESFANLSALAGHPNAYLWTIIEQFVPEMAVLFRLILEGKA